MSITPGDTDTITEPCEGCGTDTPHEVSIEIREEADGENAAASREPIRVAECQHCGEEKQDRVNGVRPP